MKKSTWVPRSIINEHEHTKAIVSKQRTEINGKSIPELEIQKSSHLETIKAIENILASTQCQSTWNFLKKKVKAKIESLDKNLWARESLLFDLNRMHMGYQLDPSNKNTTIEINRVQLISILIKQHDLDKTLYYLLFNILLYSLKPPPAYYFHTKLDKLEKLARARSLFKEFRKLSNEIGLSITVDDLASDFFRYGFILDDENFSHYLPEGDNQLDSLLVEQIKKKVTEDLQSLEKSTSILEDVYEAVDKKLNAANQIQKSLPKPNHKNSSRNYFIYKLCGAMFYFFDLPLYSHTTRLTSAIFEDYDLTQETTTDIYKKFKPIFGDIPFASKSRVHKKIDPQTIFPCSITSYQFLELLGTQYYSED